MADRASAVGALSDLVRVVALASAIAAFFVFGLDGGVKFTLVFLALAVPRLVGSIPAPFDLAYCITLLLATWSATAAWYRAIPWIDWPVHGVTTGSIAAMLYLLMDRFGLFPGLQDRPLSSHPSGILLLTVALGFAAGAVWELYEWLANNVFGASILVSYDDTIADLLMGGCGALIAGIGLITWAAHLRSERESGLLTHR